MFPTSAVTWALDVEEASAFSTALLGLLVPDGQALAFVASVVVASTIVAAVFTIWRKQFYHQRGRLLYESTDGGDQIIVPMVGEKPKETAMLAGRLAAAHDAGKVVLLDFVSDDDIERSDSAGHTYTFPEGITLAPDETITLHTGSGTNTKTDVYWGSDSPIWNNGGDTITVKNTEDETILKDGLLQLRDQIARLSNSGSIGTRTENPHRITSDL